VQETSNAYSRDYSIFSKEPSVVVRPESVSDITAVLAWAGSHAVPVVARAGGSNTGGAAITDGVLLLMNSPAFDTIDIDEEKRVVTVGCGVRHDKLQRALSEKGFWLPSDPSSGPLSYLGGNINTRASGPHALRHGAINNYVISLSGVSARGEQFDTREPDSVPYTIRVPLRQLANRINGDSEVINRLRQKRGLKWASGYDLLPLAESEAHPVSAIPALVSGSMGSLCVVTTARLRIVPRPVCAGTLLLPFPDADAACTMAHEIRRVASAVEIMNRSSISLVRKNKHLPLHPNAVTLLLVEVEGETLEEVSELLTQARAASETCGAIRDGIRTARDQIEIENLWKARKSLLPSLNSAAKNREARPYSVVNDVGVSPERLGGLLRGAEQVFERWHLQAAIYGHAGSGNLHLRPLLPRGDQTAAKEIAREIYGLVTRLNGTITAEHGMGRLRAPFLEDEWGANVVGFMKEVKAIFDPDNLLNPGAMFPPDGHDFSRFGWPDTPQLD
jgi:FAD/FMN-containing dehydrogenase